MSYSSKYGKRPFEFASMSSHSHIINDEEVKSFINNCKYPKTKDEILLDSTLIVDVNYDVKSPIQHIITVDGGYTTIPVKKSFPSSQITFFQFGTLLLNLSDLNDLSEQPFISRESMAKLNELERDKLVLPTKNVSFNDAETFVHSVRHTIYDFFKRKNDDTNLLDTLHWFLYQTYDTPLKSYQLARCPYCSEPKKVQLNRDGFNSQYGHPCSECGQEILITDVFRLHEVIDNELGAGGILGYLTNLIEHFNILHQIKNILSLKPALMGNFLFLKDGPLAFFGQTANMHKPMRNLCNFLFKEHGLFIAGLEKSGAFVEHADEIKSLLQPGQAFLLNNKHIYSYILPGDTDTPEPYARTSYYGSKIIFKTREERIYVITLPVSNENIVLNPQRSDFRNLDVILAHIERLRCDLYDNSIVPVALANKLVSLSNHPSSKILEKYSKVNIK